MTTSSPSYRHHGLLPLSWWPLQSVPLSDPFFTEANLFPFDFVQFPSSVSQYGRAYPGFWLLLLFSVSPAQFWSCLWLHLPSCLSRGSSFAVLPNVCYTRKGAYFHLLIQLIIVKGLFYFFPCWFACHCLILVLAMYVYLHIFFN